jgi:hypothetical protein
MSIVGSVLISLQGIEYLYWRSEDNTKKVFAGLIAVTVNESVRIFFFQWHCHSILQEDAGIIRCCGQHDKIMVFSHNSKS